LLRHHVYVDLRDTSFACRVCGAPCDHWIGVCLVPEIVVAAGRLGGIEAMRTLTGTFTEVPQ
jgi:hypothetical protein